MGSPWPAPLPGEQTTDGRGPNFALRRAVVLLVVVAAIGAGAAWLIKKSGDDAGDGSGSGNQWNTVVLQDADSGKVTLTDADGQEIDSFPTDLKGMIDVGLPGRLVVGVAGEASTDGLGVIDLDHGTVTDLKVESDGISRLDDSAYLLASGDPRDPLGLIDVAAGKVIDLLTLVDADAPIITPSLVRIDPEHSHIAFTELSELETVLVDLVSHKSVSLAGSLADIASGGVLTITSRRETSLVDLYGFDGERIGTVETDAAAGALLLDSRSALVITRAGGLARVDFDGETVHEIGTIAQQLTNEGTTNDDTTASDTETTTDEGHVELVRGVVPVLDRTRLLVLGDGGMVIIDVEGKVIATDRVVDARAPDVTSADRCVLIGALNEEQTLWDTSDGTRIETLDPGFMSGRSADACTITYVENPGNNDDKNTTRLIGPDVDRSVSGHLGAVAPDGSAAVGFDDDGGFVLDAESGDRVDLPVDTSYAVFADR